MTSSGYGQRYRNNNNSPTMMTSKQKQHKQPSLGLSKLTVETNMNQNNSIQNSSMDQAISNTNNYSYYSSSGNYTPSFHGMPSPQVGTPVSHHSHNNMSTTSSTADQTATSDSHPDMLNQSNATAQGLPTESQLVLLCLDYLRDLRRAYDPLDLEELEGLDSDYLSVAIFALSRTFTRPASLQEHNDCFMDIQKQLPLSPSRRRQVKKGRNNFSNDSGGGNSNSAPYIPPMDVINHEILYAENPHLPDDEDDHGDQKKENDPEDSDPYLWYEYDDMHPANVHRFYPLSGLASGPSLSGPLTLGEIAAAGLAGLGARSREAAEQDMIQSPLFEQFVQAVKSKGFFMDPDNDTPLPDPHAEQLRQIRQKKNYEERYRKVVAKFRNKLSMKADSPQKQSQQGGPGTPRSQSSPSNNNINNSFQQGSSGGNTNNNANWLALTSADRHRRRREQALELLRAKKSGGGGDAYHHGDEHNSSFATTNSGNNQSFPHTPDRRIQNRSSSPGMSSRNTSTDRFLNLSHDSAIGGTPTRSPAPTATAAASTPVNTSAVGGTPSSDQRHHPSDLEQAERAKAEGNLFMQKKLYPQAVESYTTALKISPDGPHSHVYFSNRAAALLSMKKFQDAILDSERSLALRPDYGKAHARLGLAHFLSGNYRQAVEAYTVSLKYDPHNASSKSYLEKAAKRLAENEGNKDKLPGPIQSSFSLVSEWDSNQRHKQPQPQQQQHSGMPSQILDTSSTTDGNNNTNKVEQQREAEKYKAKGNAFMAHREYQLALDAYTQAITLSPEGPQSHVYYSNRAAALCYLERYHDAVDDSEQSLALNPSYGKAHARLGLSKFFLHDYAGAVAAYTAALEHDPDNAASQSYLAKAKAKLEGRSSSRIRSSSRNPSPAHRRHPSHS